MYINEIIEEIKKEATWVDYSQTRDVILKLLELFKLADTAADDCINALASEVSDYEDAVMIESAVRIEADYIMTRNINDYKKSPVPVILPEEFLALEKN